MVQTAIVLMGGMPSSDEPTDQQECYGTQASQMEKSLPLLGTK